MQVSTFSMTLPKKHGSSEPKGVEVIMLTRGGVGGIMMGGVKNLMILLSSLLKDMLRVK